MALLYITPTLNRIFLRQFVYEVYRYSVYLAVIFCSTQILYNVLIMFVSSYWKRVCMHGPAFVYAGADLGFSEGGG